MSHAYPWARDGALKLEHVASCLKCRDLVIVSPRGRLVNPYASDRDRIRAMVRADSRHGFATPGGSGHYRCRAYLWTKGTS